MFPYIRNTANVLGDMKTMLENLNTLHNAALVFKQNIILISAKIDKVNI